MNINFLKKQISLFLVILMVVSSTAFSFSSSQPSKITREQLKVRADKTIEYYHKEFRKVKFKGLMDWPAVGLSCFGEDLSSKKWTASTGENAIYWRENEVKENIRLSTVKNTDFQRTIIGVCAAGKDPRNFGGKNLVEIVKGTMLENGHFADSVKDRKTGKPVGEDLVNSQCFGVISLYCAGEEIPNKEKCLAWLLNQQHLDGGFTFDVKRFKNPEDYKYIDSDIDMTAGGLMAMAILGLKKDDKNVVKALDFIKENQLKSGGFHSWGMENPESTVWVINALTLLKIDPMGEAWTNESGKNPVTALLEFQIENGSFSHVLSKEDDLPIFDNGMSTEQALYGMASAYNNESVYETLHKRYIY